MVLFLCVGNAARSLMAEAIFNADPPPGWVGASAGTQPAVRADPRTEPLLAEIGVRAPAHPPTRLTREILDAARVRVTMGCLDDASCPAYLKGLELRDWSLADPRDLGEDSFRRVRDQIVSLVKSLRTELIVADRVAAERVRSLAR